MNQELFNKIDLGLTIIKKGSLRKDNCYFIQNNKYISKVKKIKLSQLNTKVKFLKLMKNVLSN